MIWLVMYPSLVTGPVGLGKSQDSMGGGGGGNHLVESKMQRVTNCDIIYLYTFPSSVRILKYNISSW